MNKYTLLLGLILVFSLPFYFPGVVPPVIQLPFGLPFTISMTLVPFILALTYAWADRKGAGIIFLLIGIFDVRKAKPWAILFSFLHVPFAAVLTYFTMKVLSLPLPTPVVFQFQNILPLLFIFFLGAIPEELAWTSTLTEPLAKQHGPFGAGLMIGLVWSLWHVIPWSRGNTTAWVIGMFFFATILRVVMVYTFMLGGRSVFTGVVIHMMANTIFNLFPNSGSHTNTPILSFWMAVILVLLYFGINIRKRKAQEKIEQHQGSLGIP